MGHVRTRKARCGHRPARGRPKSCAQPCVTLFLRARSRLSIAAVAGQHRLWSFARLVQARRRSIGPGASRTPRLPQLQPDYQALAVEGPAHATAALAGAAEDARHLQVRFCQNRGSSFSVCYGNDDNAEFIHAKDDIEWKSTKDSSTEVGVEDLKSAGRIGNEINHAI
jgi:hypothetical protein